MMSDSNLMLETLIRERWGLHLGTIFHLLGLRAFFRVG